MCFVVHSLAGGGSERAVVQFLKFIDRSRFEPVLLVLDKEGPYLSEVPKDVRVLDCARRSERTALGWFRRFIGFLDDELPQTVVSFYWFNNLISILAKRLSRAKFKLLVSERSTIHGSREPIVGEASRRASVFIAYRAADRVLPNSHALRDQLVGAYRLRASSVSTLHNPVDLAGIAEHARAPADWAAPSEPTVMAVGRLGPEKGQDVLLRAMALARQPFELVLLGEGKERGRLEALARELGLSRRVHFAGFQRNPYAVLKSATVFVLPSHYEGFPNVLLEAMALGLPCVATRCPTGPEEIITSGEDGLLVPVADPAAMASALDRLLGDEVLRGRLGRAARQRVEAFDAPVIARRLESLLDEVAG